MQRTLVSSGSPYEPVIGFSRATRIGAHIAVSGSAPIAPDGTNVAVGDAYGQAKRCLEIIKQALEEAGGHIGQVIRTRMLITDAAVWEEVGRAHGEMFGDIRPASTMVVVAGLLDKDWLVEMEADAIVD